MASIVGKLQDGCKPVLWKLFCKVLSNMIMHDFCQFGVVKAQDLILDSFKRLDLNNKALVGLCSNFLMNFSAEIDVISTAKDDCAIKFTALIINLVNNAVLTNESILKLSIALVNMVVLKPATKSTEVTGAAQKLGTLLEGVKSPAKDRLIDNLRKISS